MKEEELKQEIERAIRTTLVVVNKISIRIAVDKIYDLIKTNEL